MSCNFLKTYTAVDINQVISYFLKKETKKTSTTFQTKKKDEKNATNRDFPEIFEFGSQLCFNLTFGLFWFLNIFNPYFFKEC